MKIDIQPDIGKQAIQMLKEHIIQLDKIEQLILDKNKRIAELENKLKEYEKNGSKK